ncbi:hypothetical protein [Paenibacillus sp. 598K]|uniref:hypothetical protein n=1 Tax=Paenibacillus sp. 598K TaxID=1117987 RepID=UPI0021A98390|nr:hypothetical protein [Paenibacillus sp. 598K]
MNQQYQTSTGLPERAARRSTTQSKIVFLIVWVLLIGSGVAGALWYSDKQQAELTAAIEQQTARQIAAVQEDYQLQIAQLQSGFATEITQLEGKVNALNELLTFAKDNTTEKTDNSNQLYTQINEVNKKLNELKKSLDVLK